MKLNVGGIVWLCEFTPLLLCLLVINDGVIVEDDPFLGADIDLSVISLPLFKGKRCWRMDLSGLKPRFRSLPQTPGTEALASAKTRKLLLIK